MFLGTFFRNRSQYLFNCTSHTSSINFIRKKLFLQKHFEIAEMFECPSLYLCDHFSELKREVNISFTKKLLKKEDEYVKTK